MRTRQTIKRQLRIDQTQAKGKYVYIPESGFGPMCTDMGEAAQLTKEGIKRALRAFGIEEAKVFTDSEFITAKEKEHVLKVWERFLKNGCQYGQFTKALYNHLTLHCSFIAHYDRQGFYSYYFTDPAKTVDFVGQFDRDKNYKSAEYSDIYWLTNSEYSDINQAMCEVINRYKADIYANCQSDEFKQDMATVIALMTKHQISLVQAVGGGYKFV